MRGLRESRWDSGNLVRELWGNDRRERKDRREANKSSLSPTISPVCPGPACSWPFHSTGGNRENGVSLKRPIGNSQPADRPKVGRALRALPRRRAGRREKLPAPPRNTR